MITLQAYYDIRPNVALQIESEEVPEDLPGNDRAGNGLIFGNGLSYLKIRQSGRQSFLLESVKGSLNLVRIINPAGTLAAIPASLPISAGSIFQTGNR
jgi:hypothetical protein